MVSVKSYLFYSEKYLLLNLSQCEYCGYLVKYFTSITGLNSYSPRLLGVLMAFFLSLFFFFSVLIDL